MSNQATETIYHCMVYSVNGTIYTIRFLHNIPTVITVKNASHTHNAYVTHFNQAEVNAVFHQEPQFDEGIVSVKHNGCAPMYGRYTFIHKNGSESIIETHGI